MTSSVIAHPLVRRPASARRADPLVVALLLAAVAGLVALGLVVAAPAPAPGAPREALVVFANGRPHAALQRARAAAGPGVALRVPRTPSEATLDLRYLAASGYDRIVAAGPGAASVVREVAPAYPGTRFVVRR
jgi:basic membrane lipoprotein Med (substrate-binding protein (PBP1-ABC) superfamily)